MLKRKTISKKELPHFGGAFLIYSSSIYGNSTTVQPNSLIFNYIIKY
uniref:Uncharacterized protein n=1 Tax=Myoviridae sp. ctgr818 TaxID=2825150 RepID=A0A8S5PCN7_9CAUD|nr:MAG TPA: hypothetical protein [Myoviridae sp. ctgr818]DAP11189.1 MAG TPA: hypothetical protein [Caudoviricetes sp.]